MDMIGKDLNFYIYHKKKKQNYLIDNHIKYWFRGDD